MGAKNCPVGRNGLAKPQVPPTSEALIKIYMYVVRGNLQEVRRQLKRGLPPDVMDNYLMIHWAVSSGQLEILKLLLHSGADVNRQNVQGVTALYFAVEKNSLDAVRLLVERDEILVDLKRDRKRWKVWTPLIKACHEGYYSIVALLLNKGADVNGETDDGNSPLYAAANKNRENVIRLLLDQDDILVDGKTSNGWTPLQIICFRGNYNIAELVLKKGAYVNSQSDEGYCPLYWAVTMNHLEVVGLMLDQPGVRTDLREKSHGNTPLHRAELGT